MLHRATTIPTLACMNTVAQLAPLPGAATDALAALCKATGDTLRLDILRVLRNDSFGVLELAQIFAMRQSGMSHHLKVLAKAGLVITRREGNSIFYRRSLPAGDSHWCRVHEQLLAGLMLWRWMLNWPMASARFIVNAAPCRNSFFPALPTAHQRRRPAGAYQPVP